MTMVLPEKVALGLFLACALANVGQVAFFWQRLPDAIPLHYGIANEPSMALPRSWFRVLWLGLVVGVTTALYLTTPQGSLAFGAVTLLFVFAITRLLVLAAIRGFVSIGGILATCALYIALSMLTSSPSR